MRKRPLVFVLVLPVTIFALLLTPLVFVETETIYAQIGVAITNVPPTNTHNAFNENANATSPTPTTKANIAAPHITMMTTKATTTSQRTKNLQTTFGELAKCIAAGTCRPIIGSEGDDRIQGGNGSNLIIGLAGNDIIHGGTGDSIIIGGPGNDKLYGGAGNDVLVGGAGADYFACGSSGTGATSASKSVVLNFNASKGDDTD